MPPKSAQSIDAASSSGDTDSSSLHDSLYDSDEDGSITDTLKTQWLRDRIKHEHGREYIDSEGKGSAWFPIDETQRDQLDLFHAIYTTAMSIAEATPDKLFRSPIGTNPQRILDVGTGTGIWAISVADKYPSAEVVGFDTAPVQPHWVPPNVKFEVENVENDWTYKAESFDLVHVRAMHALVPDWDKFFKNVLRVLKPGGYVEIYAEVPRIKSDDDTLVKEYLFPEWIGNLEKGLNIAGSTLYMDGEEKNVKRSMTDVGFENMSEVWYKVPIGPWPKDPRMKNLGAMMMINVLQGIEGWSLALYTKALNWTLEDTKKYVEDVKKSLRNKKVHSYMPFISIIAQKPAAAI